MTNDSIKRVSEVFELYTANVSTIAHSYDSIDFIRGKINFLTYFSDIVRHIGIITYPIIRNIYYLFLDIPTTSELFSLSVSNRGYIMTNAGLSFYYGGYLIGFILDIFSFVILIKIIHFLNYKQNKSVHVGMIYVYSFIQILVSLVIINNNLLFLQGITGYIFVVFIFIKINDLGKIRIKS
jgi:hypothetical protein